MDKLKAPRDEPVSRMEAPMGSGTKENRAQVPEAGAGFAAASGPLRAVRALSSPVYRFYYYALLSHMACMNMQLIARSLLVYRLTGSSWILGLVALAQALPMMALSLIGGVLADRLQKKYVVMVGQAVSLLVALGVAVLLDIGYLSADRAGAWVVLVVASLLQGTVMGLMMPSRQALVAEIVPAGDLMNAVALNVLGMNTLRIIAPALAGLIIDRFGFETVYYLICVMYLSAVLFLIPLPLTRIKKRRLDGLFTDLKLGLQYVRQESTILHLLILALFLVVLSMPYMFLMPVFADDILMVGATGMGLLFAVSGLGAMAGSITLAVLPNRKRGAMLLGSGLLLGVGLLGFAFSRSWPLSLILMVFVGLGHSGRMTLSNTLLQYYVADEYRGRVMSLYMMEFGLMGFGVFIAGAMAEVLGVEWAVGGLAGALTLICLLGMGFLPRIRKLD